MEGVARPGGPADWALRRFGGNYPDATVVLARQCHAEVLGKLGLSLALFNISDGTASREGWRLALFSLISLLGMMVDSELSAKLEISVTFNWSELRDSDLTGHALDFKALMDGGFEKDAAARLAGFSQD